MSGRFQRPAEAGASCAAVRPPGAAAASSAGPPFRPAPMIDQHTSPTAAKCRKQSRRCFRRPPPFSLPFAIRAERETQNPPVVVQASACTVALAVAQASRLHQCQGVQASSLYKSRCRLEACTTRRRTRPLRRGCPKGACQPLGHALRLSPTSPLDGGLNPCVTTYYWLPCKACQAKNENEKNRKNGGGVGGGNFFAGNRLRQLRLAK